MKTIHLIRKSFPGLLITIIIGSVLLFTSCSKGYNSVTINTQTYATTGNASGSQENPPTSSSGSGTLSGTYNAMTNNWQYAINWSSLSSTATAVEIHGPADIGVNGSFVLALSITTSGINGNATGSAMLTEQQEADLIAGRLYYTLLTATNISGEIRGQISATLQ